MLFTSGGLFGSYSRLTINKSITYRWFLLVRGLRFIKLCSECGGSSDPAVLLGIGQCKFADCARFFWSPQPPAWLRLSDPAWPISRSQHPKRSRPAKIRYGRRRCATQSMPRCCAPAPGTIARLRNHLSL